MHSIRGTLTLTMIISITLIGTAQTVMLKLGQGKTDKKDTDVKAIDTDTDLACQDYYAYYVGKRIPGPTQLQWMEVKDLVSLPGRVRFNGVGVEGGRYWRAAISSDLCDMEIPLAKGDSAGAFFLQPAQGPLSGMPTSAGAGRSLDDDCGACNSFAKYRLIYDVSTDEISVLQWERRHGKRPAGWASVTNRIIRPGVNRMVEVKYANFNALRDSLSLDFKWDQYNMEGSGDFQNAVMRGPSAPLPPAKEKEAQTKDAEGAKEQTETNGGSEVTLNAKSSDECQAWIKRLDTLRTVHENLVTQLKKDHTKADLKEFQATVANLLKEFNPALDLDSEVGYAVQLDGAINACAKTWGENTTKKARATLKALREARDIYQRKLDLDALADMATAYEAVEYKAKAEAVTPSFYDLREALVTIARKFFPKRFSGTVDASSLKELGDIADKAKAAGILGSDDAVSVYKKKAEAMAKTYDLLTTYRTNSIAPLQMHDFDVLSLQFMKNGRALNASPYEIHTSGGWKIDFSSGIVFSKARDESYFYKDLRKTTTTRSDTAISSSGGDSTTTITHVDSTLYYGTIGSNTPDQWAWGLCVMAHFYPRTGLVFNPSISLGMLVKQDGVSPMLGFSILCGRKHRVALTGGTIFANVQRLRSGYEVDSEYEITSDTGVNAEVPNTERVIRLGFFASLTYNFASARLNVR